MPRTILLATAASVLFASASPAAAPQFDTPAKVAYLIDLSSGAVLYEKNADVRMRPTHIRTSAPRPSSRQPTITA